MGPRSTQLSVFCRNIMKTPARVSVGGDGVDPSPIIQVKATQQGQYVGPILTILGPMMVPVGPAS